MNTITTTINVTIGTDVVDVLLVLEGVGAVLVLECNDCCVTMKIYASSLPSHQPFLFLCLLSKLFSMACEQT
jgi:hypothetical protein